MFMLYYWPRFSPWHNNIRSPEHSQRKTSALSGEALKQTNEKSNISFNNVVPEREHCRSSCIKDAAEKWLCHPHVALRPLLFVVTRQFQGMGDALVCGSAAVSGEKQQREAFLQGRTGGTSSMRSASRQGGPAWPSLLWGRLMPGTGGDTHRWSSVTKDSERDPSLEGPAETSDAHSQIPLFAAAAAHRHVCRARGSGEDR